MPRVIQIRGFKSMADRDFYNRRPSVIVGYACTEEELIKVMRDCKREDIKCFGFFYNKQQLLLYSEAVNILNSSEVLSYKKLRKNEKSPLR